MAVHDTFNAGDDIVLSIESYPARDLANRDYTEYRLVHRDKAGEFQAFLASGDYAFVREALRERIYNAFAGTVDAASEAIAEAACQAIIGRTNVGACRRAAAKRVAERFGFKVIDPDLDGIDI